jgi:hypothetical protein
VSGDEQSLRKTEQCARMVGNIVVHVNVSFVEIGLRMFLDSAQKSPLVLTIHTCISIRCGYNVCTF